jgi:hypothetical protein
MFPVDIGDHRQGRGIFRKEPSLSSASATRKSPPPEPALEPRLLSLPPITTVGSRPPRASTEATIEVVVVLPWAPATATLYLRRISSASISARGITGTHARPGRRTSGLSGRTAEEITTTSAPRDLVAGMADGDRPAQFAEPLGDVGRPQIGAGTR